MTRSVTNGTESTTSAVQVTVVRTRPNGTSTAHETYECTAGPDWRVLDVLDSLADHGVDIGYRWFCSTRRCGACTMRMNGKPILACWEAAEPEMLLEPLASTPVLVDFVDDRDAYELSLAAVHPILERAEPYQGFPESVDPGEMAASDALAACIECLLCVEACPVADLHGTRWIGPAVAVQLGRVALNPLDGADRQADIARSGVEHCIGPEPCETACQTICPTDVPVYTGAVRPLREAAGLTQVE